MKFNFKIKGEDLKKKLGIKEVDLKPLKEDLDKQISDLKDSIPDPKKFSDLERIVKENNSHQLYTGVSETRVKELIKSTPGIGGGGGSGGGGSDTIWQQDPTTKVITPITEGDLDMELNSLLNTKITGTALNSTILVSTNPPVNPYPYQLWIRLNP